MMFRARKPSAQMEFDHQIAVVPGGFVAGEQLVFIISVLVHVKNTCGPLDVKQPLDLLFEFVASFVEVLLTKLSYVMLRLEIATRGISTFNA